MKKLITYIFSLLVSLWLLFAKEKEVKKAPELLPLNLQFFAEDPKDPPADPQDPPDDDKTFNQDDVNKIVKDRVSRAEKKAQKELAKQLGFDSVDAMTEALNKDKDKDKKIEDDPIDVDAVVEAKLKEERDKTFKRLVNSEVKLLANELGFADWEDALALADLSEVKEDEKGNIVGVKEALEALTKKKAHLLKQTQSNRFGADVPNNQQQSKTKLEDIKKLASTRGAQQTTTNNPWA